MILRNKLTKEIINIPYNDFKTRFSKEQQVAFERYFQKKLNPSLILCWDMFSAR